MAFTPLMKDACLALVFLFGVYMVISVSSYSYFTDTDEVSMSVTTGTWCGVPDDFPIDVSGALLTGHGQQGFHLHNIFLENRGGVPVVITGVIAAWEPGDGGEILQRVQFMGNFVGANGFIPETTMGKDGEEDEGTAFNAENAVIPADIGYAGGAGEVPSGTFDGTGGYFWTGEAACGSCVNGLCEIEPAGHVNLHCWFDSDMSGKTIYLTFVFDDGSQKGVSVLV